MPIHFLPNSLIAFTNILLLSVTLYIFDVYHVTRNKHFLSLKNIPGYLRREAPGILWEAVVPELPSAHVMFAFLLPRSAAELWAALSHIPW